MKPTDRQPDFSQLEKVLRNEVPDRPVLFEMSICGKYLKEMADPNISEDWSDFGLSDYLISAQRNLGYDY